MGWGARARARMAQRRRSLPLGENDGEYWGLYHVTYLRFLESIGEEGLNPGAVGVWDKTGYGSHSRKGLFLTEPDGIYFWYQRLEDMAESQNEPEDLYEWTPVVLYAEVLMDDSVKPDVLGTRDAFAKAYVTTQHIPPEEIQMWNGAAWVAVGPFDVVAAGGIKWVKEEDGEWWQFPLDTPLIPTHEPHGGVIE